jgi:DHA3 family macrolide efflux protein-like MFS transporter
MSDQIPTQLDAALDAALEPAIEVAPAAPEPMTMGAVLRVVTMRRLWYAQIVSTFGDFLALFAVITVMTFKLHATPQQVTGVQIAYLLPIALISVISGVFVDRWPVKTTLVTSDFIRAGLCLLLLFVHSVYGFYAALAAISVISSFFSPAQGVAIRAAVPFHGLRSANALMQQVMFIMRIIGPSIAILLVGAFGAKICYWLDSASFIASGSLIASLVLIVPKSPSTNNLSSRPESSRPYREDAAERPEGKVATELSGIPRILADMKEGAGFILHHAALLFVIVALAAAMFVMGCFGPLIAVYVRDVLHALTKTYSIVSAMIGFGLLIGVNALNAFAKKMSNTLQVYLGLGGIALGTALLAFIPLVATTILGCFLIGFAAAGVIVPAQTLVQQETPAELMGRVGSTLMSAIFTAQIAGLVLSGILAQYTSIRRVFVLCTIMLAALIIAGKLWMEPKQPAPAA